MNRQYAVRRRFYTNSGSHMGRLSRVMLHLAFLCCVACAHAGEGGASASDSAEKASGSADKKFDFYDYSTWPRSTSALKKFKEIADEQSGYKLSARRASKGSQDQYRKCSYYLKMLTSAAQREVDPVYSTDDDQAPALKKYRKQCPIYSKNGEHARDDDYLQQYIGSFNYKLFKLKRKSGATVDLICADINSSFSEAEGFVQCALPDVRRCGFVKYDHRGGRGIPVLMVATSVNNKERVPDANYPYGISVIYFDGVYYGLSAAKQPVSDASGYYAFRFQSLDPGVNASCYWSFSFNK